MPRWLAAELLFTGDKIAAERLYQLGVVNHLTEDGVALETAFEVAGRLEAGPKDAIMRAKTLLAQAAITDFDDQLEAEADNLAQALGGAEAAEGISAFIDRRAPDFQKNRPPRAVDSDGSAILHREQVFLAFYLDNYLPQQGYFIWCACLQRLQGKMAAHLCARRNRR